MSSPTPSRDSGGEDRMRSQRNIVPPQNDLQGPDSEENSTGLLEPTVVQVPQSNSNVVMRPRGPPSSDDEEGEEDEQKQSTISEFLRKNPAAPGDPQFSSENRRLNIIAMDRKRRLTANAHEGGRRRTMNGTYHSRGLSGQPSQSRYVPQLDGPSSSTGPSRWPRRSSSQEIPQAHIIDLTSPPAPASASLPSQLQRRPSAGSPIHSLRLRTVPRWQPDGEVSECPICKRQFGWLFRRHHCRKCGRVVCNECSPHRIIIPSEFIVRLPNESVQVAINQASSNPGGTDGWRSVEAIHLTDDGDGPSPSRSPTWADAARTDPITGGERVRLCNPCVPDPQPSPHLDFTPTNDGLVDRTGPGGVEASARQGQIISPSNTAREDPFNPHREQYGSTEQARVFREQRGRGMLFPNEGPEPWRGHSQPDGFTASTDGLPPYGFTDRSRGTNAARQGYAASYQYPPTAMPVLPHFMTTGGLLNFARGAMGAQPNRSPTTYSPHNVPTQSIYSPSNSNLSSPYSAHPNLGHGRYHSFHAAPSSPSSSASSATRPGPPLPRHLHPNQTTTQRPRVRSLLDVDPRYLPTPQHRSSSDDPSAPPQQPYPPSSTRPPRPLIRESDLCPICRHILPPVSPSGSEASREAHIMACINARDPSSSVSGNFPRTSSTITSSSTSLPINSGHLDAPLPPLPPAAVYMLPFTATEKDCVAQEDGSPAECSICMVEYEIGDRLARLECLCKFHRDCIRSWFERRRECPVHKVS